MAKMSAAAKKKFVARMKRAKAAKKRGKSKTKSKSKRRSRRTSNPVLGVQVKPLVKSGVGIAIGAYVGSMIASMVGQQAVSRLPVGIFQAVGYAAGGVGELILGEWFQKKAKSLPIREAAMDGFGGRERDRE